VASLQNASLVPARIVPGGECLERAFAKVLSIPETEMCRLEQLGYLKQGEELHAKMYLGKYDIHFYHN